MAEILEKILTCDFTALHPEKFYDVKEQVKPINTKRKLNYSAVVVLAIAASVFFVGFSVFMSETDEITIISATKLTLAGGTALEERQYGDYRCEMISAVAPRPLEYACSLDEDGVSTDGANCRDPYGGAATSITMQHPSQFYASAEECSMAENWKKVRTTLYAAHLFCCCWLASSLI